jgi:hypothetical protein
LEELGRDFSTVRGDLQRGFDIFKRFVELNLEWKFLKESK